MLTKGTAANADRTAYDTLAKEQYDYTVGKDIATARDPLVFNQKTTDKGAVITQVRAGSGYLQQKLEQQDVAQGTVATGDQRTFTVLEYAKSIPISRTFKMDEQHEVVADTIKDEATLLRTTQDKNALENWANGFTTATTNDGTAIFSNSHTTLSSTTIDNLETGTLTATNLETAFVALKRQARQDGTLGYHEPRLLLTPVNLHKEAMEITQSELKPNSANNDMNYYSQIYPELVVKTSPFLDTVSTTAWFLASKNHTMNRWVRESFYSTFVGWETQSNNDFVYKFGYREVTGCETPNGMLGSNGTV